MNNNFDNISDDLLAAYLNGNTTQAETQQILDALRYDKKLQEFMQVALDVKFHDIAYEQCSTLPMTALAANNSIDNLCTIICERHALLTLGIPTKIERLTSLAAGKGWLRENGAPLHHIGRICDTFGLAVSRQYDSTLEKVDEYIRSGKQILAAVNRAVLHDKETTEQMPDHVVHIERVTDDYIKIFEPDTLTESAIPAERFVRAWQMSQNYIVAIYDDPYSYEPHPIDTSDIEIEEDLIDLQEALAENAHEIWAYNRKAEGWTWGPVRDDAKKENPDMIPYGCLPESEKEYDREMAINTLKLVKKLGYDIIKREE